MKKVLFLLIALLICGAVNAQSYQRNGNDFTQISTRNISSTATQTKYTWTDSKGNKYPIFVTKNGRCFVNKISGKTGKEYKYYLSEDISREVCKEMGITYQEKTKK